MLLQGIQGETAVSVAEGIALIPFVSDKGLPILNLWSEPCGETLAAACAIERRCEPSSGALACSDYKSAITQPRIDLR